MCTWGERALLHSYHDCRLFVYDPMEANGALTVVPHAPPVSYWGSSPIMMHVDGDTLFTSGGRNGDLNAIDLGPVYDKTSYHDNPQQTKAFWRARISTCGYRICGEE